MNNVLADILSIANSLVFGGLGLVAFINGLDCWRECYLKHPKNSDPCWSWFLLALTGFYWSALYLWVLFVPPGLYDPVEFGRIFIRPAYIVTGGSMLIIAIVYAKRRGTIYRLRHGCHENDDK